MRLAILSDIHGNLAALEAVLAHLRQHAPDLVVNLGDCATGPLWPRETCDALDALALPTVRGNHDRWIARPPGPGDTPSVVFTRAALREERRAALGDLPPSLDPVEGVLAVHGTPDSDTAYLLEDAIDGRLALAAASEVSRRLEGQVADLVLCGHSHTSHVVAVGGRLVVNPGSVGCPRHADNADYRAAEPGSPHARYALATRRGRAWTVELVALAYDWSVVAERAQANGRADFAHAFLAGASG
jgi:predicted phosphodiesterase